MVSKLIFSVKHLICSRKCRKIFLSGLIFVLFLMIVLVFVDFYVASAATDKLYTDIEKVPHKKAALVLGTAKFIETRDNWYYNFRIDAAAQLWKAGKIDAILVSGDNSRSDYDEPTTMKEDLVAKGIPAEFITVDYAGFRTLDSIVRAEKVFGLQDYIIVSQPFHCVRAVYLAQRNGQNVIAWAASDIRGDFKMRLREVLARNKAVFDILTQKTPKFLGPKENVNYRPQVPQEQFTRQ